VTAKTVCIYCRVGADQPFAKPEHVLPQSFGKFEQNFTLHRVCDACNQTMGDQLEVFFGRDTAEGFQRLLFGLKPQSEARQIRGKRLEFRILQKGPYEGAYVQLTHNEKQGLTVSLVPQVAFRHPAGDEWVWFRERELTEESVTRYRRHTESRVFGSIEDMARIQAKLSELGVHAGDGLIAGDPELPGSEVDVQVTYTIDEIVLRTIAKIAFNYVAYVTNDIPDFILHSEFDAVRRYIRYGEDPGRSVVRGTTAKILDRDTKQFKITHGHILTVDWRPEGFVVCHVSLFNGLTYRVYLTRGAPGLVWWDLLVCHVFDVAARSIVGASSARRILVERP
jgi:hypothetical protein